MQKMPVFLSIFQKTLWKKSLFWLLGIITCSPSVRDRLMPLGGRLVRCVHSCMQVFVCSFNKHVLRDGACSLRGCRTEQKETQCWGGNSGPQIITQTDGELWRAVTVPQAPRDRGLLSGEPLFIREARKSFPKGETYVGLSRVGKSKQNKAEKGEKLCRRGWLLCRVVEREICSIQGTEKRPWHGWGVSGMLVHSRKLGMVIYTIRCLFWKDN